jgi:hypothetical protein
MNSASHERNPAGSPQEEPIGSDTNHAPELTQAEQERAMAALDSVAAGRVKSAEDVLRRAEALLVR